MFVNQHGKWHLQYKSASYNLDVTPVHTSRSHACYTHNFNHVHTIPYSYYKLASCTGLHACSPSIYMQGYIACTYVTGPAKINDVNANYTELYFC